jgi:hypothetical protein
MFHSHRHWCVRRAETPAELARRGTSYSWTLCTAFELGGYLFLNDSTSENGAVEFAVVKKPDKPRGRYQQVETITFGWCCYDKALDHIRRVLAGEYDAHAFTHAVEPRFDTPDEHGIRNCGFCA